MAGQASFAEAAQGSKALVARGYLTFSVYARVDVTDTSGAADRIPGASENDFERK